MSYTPTNWETGDTITAEKLNKLEQGVANAGGSTGGGVLVVHDVDGTLDKTWQEIMDAPLAIIKEVGEDYAFLKYLVSAEADIDLYLVTFADFASALGPVKRVYQTNTQSGYPVVAGDVDE